MIELLAVANPEERKYTVLVTTDTLNYQCKALGLQVPK
jgi:hypothetical protein